MSATMDYTETLVVTHCWCGIALAIPSNLHRHAQEKGGSIYCPIGHTFHYSQTTQQLLEAEQRRHRATKDLLRAEERSHVATRGHLTRAKNRIQAGVCTECHRHFENLERHMKTKHPKAATAA